jgi:glucan phosphoethanolaminetransferase (alkaline phosphatase superfamily)
LNTVFAGCAAAWARRAVLLDIAWLGVLVAPAASAMSATVNWDLDRERIFAASCWLVLMLRALLPRGAYFLATWPIALVGALCAGADVLRRVDLLALAMQWRTYSAIELDEVVIAYGDKMAIAFFSLLLLALLAYRHAPFPKAGPRARLVLLACGVALAARIPAATWLRAWPANAALVATSAATGSRTLEQYLFPFASGVNPRDPKATWHGTRTPKAPPAESVVFVIGETVRADYLHECNGPARVRAFAPGALVACDVSSGSDTTITSVPLMVSREMPGHATRVSSDATFMRALAEAGYETSWFELQGRVIAWPDAQNMSFQAARGADDVPRLVPPLVAALARPARLKAVVLHPYNAHDPYCIRYDPAQAPYAVDCRRVRGMPDAGNIDEVRLDYANAVDASVGFVNRVIEELDRRPEPVFLVYSPDHAENLLDDGRRIWAHAMRRPSTWDTQVPAVFWANAAWRAAHPTQWRHLAAQMHAPLMHADLVPTFLAAADVRYDEPREDVADLLTQPVPERQRIVQLTFGKTITWPALDAEARDAGPGSPARFAQAGATVAKAGDPSTRAQ